MVIKWYIMLSKNEYKNFIQLPESVWYQQEKKYHNDSYRDDGIRIVAYEVYEQKIFKGRVASCRINFRRLIEKDDKISVYVEADHDEVVKRFNEIMQMLQLPTWTYWTVNRMDYCVNVKTPYVKEYIALFQKVIYRHIKDYHTIEEHETSLIRMEACTCPPEPETAVKEKIKLEARP